MLTRSSATRSLDTFARRLDDASRCLPAALPARMADALDACPDPMQLLTASQLAGSAETYQRHVLYAPDNGRLCAVAIVWRPGQRTPVHGHYTWCAYRVMRGTMEESLFSWQQEHQAALPHQTVIRTAGYAVASHAGMEAVHRLCNAGDDVAVTVHVYGVDATQLCTHVNRIAPVAVPA